MIFILITYLSLTSYKSFTFNNNYISTEKKILNKINTKNSKKQNTFYAYKYHILYLMFDTYPKSRYLHPPNIFKKEYILINDGTNSKIEADKFFDGSDSVDYIVIEQNLITFLNNFYNEFEENKFDKSKIDIKILKSESKIKKILEKYYLSEKIDDALIYKKY